VYVRQKLPSQNDNNWDKGNKNKRKIKIGKKKSKLTMQTLLQFYKGM